MANSTVNTNSINVGKPIEVLTQYNPIAGIHSSTRQNRLKKLKHFLVYTSEVALNSVHPRSCSICGEPLSAQHYALCPNCWSKFAQQQLPRDYCRICGRTAGQFSLTQNRCYECRDKRPAITYMVRVGTYHEIFRQLLLDFKFKNAQYLDLFFARMLAYAILLNPYLHSVDKFVPIPLHWRRRLERTYNQSELLAHAVRAELRDSNLNIPVCMHLVRTRYTTPQSLLPTTERQNNLKGAFAVRPDIDFTNQHLCIIDDVTTTGTTLQTAARALKRAGAAKVSAAVLAVAEEK